MNIFKLAAAAALVCTGLAAPAAPAAAQGHHRGEYRHDNARHDRGRDNHARGHHRRHRVCRTVWRHHHRQRVCTWRYRR